MRWETVAMGTRSLTPTADDIQWTPDAPPYPERISAAYLARLSTDELVDYCLDLREEVSALRTTLHAAIASVAQLTTQLKRSRDTVVRLHDNLREYRRAA